MVFMSTRFQRRGPVAELLLGGPGWRFRAWIVLVICVGATGAASAQAPTMSGHLDRSYVGRADAAICDCGQWTCPICQQHCPLGPGALSRRCPGASRATRCLHSYHPTTACPRSFRLFPGMDRQCRPRGRRRCPGMDRQCRRAWRRRRASRFCSPRHRSCRERRPGLRPPRLRRSQRPPQPAPQLAFTEQAGAFGGSTMAVPNMIGPAFGSGPTFSILTQRVPVSLVARGDILDGGFDDLNSVIAYETTGDQVANDFFSVGPGRLTEDGLVVFDISEPVPPSDAPTAPDSSYVYDGGTARRPRPFYSGELWDVNYSFSRTYEVLIPNPAETVVGRLKIAENTSPIPRDRVFVNYSLFDNVPLFPGGVTVNRFSPGFEKTVLDGWGSFEMRFPLASTLDSSFDVDGPAQTGKVQFGDLYMVGKYLLARTDRAALSAGLVVTVPTANDLRVFLSDGEQLVQVRNQTVHLMPFLGWLYAPGRFFAQGFVDVDIDTNGNEVLINQWGRGLMPSGRIQDTTLLDVNLSTGYWAFRRPARHAAAHVQGFAPMLELHLTRSLQSADVVSSGGFRIGQPRDDTQFLGLVLGGAIELCNQNMLTVGYAVPIGNGSDQPFDGELRAFWNRFF